MKVLIAPWGNPEGWKEVTYEFCKKKVRSNTSLKILQESISPDKIIIIGLDTLAKSGKTYHEVKNEAEKKIKMHVDRAGLVNYKVIIAPGIGTFPNGTFHGEALDYYYYLITHLSLILLEHSENPIEFHLDLTHGLNYTTVLTYKVVEEIAKIFSLFSDVKFKAYNADPSSLRATESLSINIIEDSVPLPTPPSEKISKERTLEPVNMSARERRQLFETDLRILREINNNELSAFIGALYNGLPLALFRFYPDREKLKDIISLSLKCYEKYIIVMYNGRLEVRKKLKIGNPLKIYIFAYVLATLLHNHNLISTSKKEICLYEIKDVKEKLFKYDERVKVRIEDDLYTLEQKLKEKEIKEWTIYNQLLGNRIGEPDKRNFLAHSGLEKNVVEVKKESEKLMLRYHEESLQTIKKMSTQGLK